MYNNSMLYHCIHYVSLITHMSIHKVLEEIFKEEILEKRKEGEEIKIKGKKGRRNVF